MHPESFVDAKTWSPRLQVGLIGAIANISCFEDWDHKAVLTVHCSIPAFPYLCDMASSSVYQGQSLPDMVSSKGWCV